MFGCVSTLYLELQKLALPMQCSSTVEIKGVENWDLRNFSSVGKRPMEATAHYFGGDVQQIPLQYMKMTGIKVLLLVLVLQDCGSSNISLKVGSTTHWTLGEGKKIL